MARALGCQFSCIITTRSTSTSLSCHYNDVESCTHILSSIRLTRSQAMKAKCTVVVDNGASTIKLGVLSRGHGEIPPKFVYAITHQLDPRADAGVLRIIQNAIIRSKGDKTTYFGQEFEQCTDYSSLNYRLPFEKVSPSVSLTFMMRYSIFTVKTGISSGLGCAESYLGQPFYV